MTKDELLAMQPEERAVLERVNVAPEDNTDCSGCSRCLSCSGCLSCSYCSYCSGCSGCSRCSRCSDCSDCSGCSDCSYCCGIINGKDLRFVAWGVQLTEEEYRRIA